MIIRLTTHTIHNTPHEQLLDCREAPSHFQYHDPATDGQVDINCLRPDMTLCNYQFTQKAPLTLYYSQPVFRFSLQLSGHVDSAVAGQNTLNRQAKQVELRYLDEQETTLTSESDTPQHWIELLLQPSFFKAALPDETDLLPPMISHNLNHPDPQSPGLCQDLTPDQLMAINQIHNNVFTGATRTLYFKSKILEIMSLFFAEQTFAQHEGQLLGDRDIDLIQQAHELLQNSVSEAPTLGEIARQIGLSESKLKRGFKSVYKQSVFGFLRSYRMEYARNMLFEQKGNISTVASAVGYTNVSHFSAAFTRHHGVKPSAYLRQIKHNNIHTLAQ